MIFKINTLYFPDQQSFLLSSQLRRDVFSVRKEVNFYIWRTSRSCFKWLWECSIMYLWFTIKTRWKEEISYRVCCGSRPVRIFIDASRRLRHDDYGW